MPGFATTAIVCAVRHHGEHGGVVRAFSRDHGLVAGYVRGSRSRRLRPVLIASNVVRAQYRYRTDEQLASMTAEPVISRGAYLGEPLTAGALDWATVLTASLLPERQAYARLYDALTALLDAICGAPSARGWAQALARYEQLLLAELGFGMALDRCAVTGATEDLRYISPRTGRAVSGTAGAAHGGKLLALSPLLVGRSDVGWPDCFDALRATGFFLDRHLFADRTTDVMASRSLLIERLKRAVE